MEEVIAKCELLGQFPFRVVGRVIVAHDQTSGITPCHILVHLATINLVLLLVVAMHEVAGQQIRRYVLCSIKWLYRQVGGKACVGLSIVKWLRQSSIGVAILIDLS